MANAMRDVIAIVMGGGKGTRLLPLTASRCKPAMCYGGCYRLIDIPISNAINSGCQKIYVITQYLSHSLHQHIFNTYRFDSLHLSSIEILSVEEKPETKRWLEGTADCIRQNLHYFQELTAEYFLVLSGDQLYQMDFSKMLTFAQETDADVVVACLPITESTTMRMGVLAIDKNHRITSFIEKPQSKRELAKKELSKNQLKELQIEDPSTSYYLGSMGIYLFKRDSLIKILQEDEREDFGRHLIPELVNRGNAAAYVHKDYWEDVGTVESYYRANMAFNSAQPPLNCYNANWRIYSNEPSLPGAQILNTHVNRAIFGKGSVIAADSVTNTIIGPRNIVESGTVIADSYICGNDSYTSHAQIGKNCVIQKAIIDQQVRIGNNVKLINQRNLSHYDGDRIHIREGIIVVAKGAHIPDGTVI